MYQDMDLDISVEYTLVESDNLNCVHILVDTIDTDRQNSQVDIDMSQYRYDRDKLHSSRKDLARTVWLVRVRYALCWRERERWKKVEKFELARFDMCAR